MEAEDYISGETSRSASLGTTKLIRWGGDWNQFKRLFKATARLNGVADATKVAESVAHGCLKQGKQPTDNDLQQYTSELEIEVKDKEKSGPEYEELQMRALQQSPKLAAPGDP